MATLRAGLAIRGLNPAETLAAIEVPARAKTMGIELLERDEVLRQSDAVSLLLRASPKTHQIIGRRELELMKPSAFLVNTGRGALVDEGALYEVLKAKRIAGAAIDVYQTEPLPADNPLLTLDNVLANALQYSPAKSKISIALVTKDNRGGLAISDGGPIVPPEFREVVLTAEGQAEAKKRYETRYGRGLGLYCAAQAARRPGRREQPRRGGSRGRSVRRASAPSCRAGSSRTRRRPSPPTSGRGPDRVGRAG